MSRSSSIILIGLGALILLGAAMAAAFFLGRGLFQISDRETIYATQEPAPITYQPTSEPHFAQDPYLLARQILEHADIEVGGGWQIEPCEGEAAVLCISENGQHAGYAELLLFPLNGYDEAHPLRQAAGQLPLLAENYSNKEAILAHQALVSLAEEHLALIQSDRAISYPEDTFTSFGMEPAQLGPLPGLVFGFYHTNPTGEVQERYLNVAAIDRHFVYWFGVYYDPNSVSTFVSDTAVSQFAPVFYDLAAILPLPAGLAESTASIP